MLVCVCVCVASPLAHFIQQQLIVQLMQASRNTMNNNTEGNHPHLDQPKETDWHAYAQPAFWLL
jgi:hypothetical protein